MSVSEQSDAAPPPLWALAAIAAGAFACVMIGAVVVEPALHRLMQTTRLPKVSSRLAPTGRVETADLDLAGRYRADAAGLVLDIDGAEIARNGGGRLDTAPHRLVSAGQAASVSRTFAQAMAVPAQAQIEVRRVVADTDSRLCGGHPVGWLAFAIRRDGFILMPARQGPPPGALAPDDRLCDVVELKR